MRCDKNMKSYYKESDITPLKKVKFPTLTAWGFTGFEFESNPSLSFIGRDVIQMCAKAQVSTLIRNDTFRCSKFGFYCVGFQNPEHLAGNNSERSDEIN